MLDDHLTKMKNIPETISVKGLTKKFGSFTAVNEVDFFVHSGEIFGFLGPNGSGKTTTIRMMLGLIKPTKGSVNILGVSATDEYKMIRHHVGYMAQKFSLYNDLTVIENLRFYGSAYGLSKSNLRNRIHDALEMSNLVGRENQKTKDLSGGWRQRLALSAAILHKPQILFLDEPTAGVDPISRRAFWDLLYTLVAQNTTVFVTTHYMDEAEHCHRLAFIQRGEIIAIGSPSEIKEQKIKEKIIELTPAKTTETIELLKQLQDSEQKLINEIEIFGTQIHVLSEYPNQLIRFLEDQFAMYKIGSVEMDIIDPTLEDIFIASMKK